MILHVDAQKSTCHLPSSFPHKVQIGQRTLAPGLFSRPGGIRDSTGYASEQEGYQIFQRHTMRQPLPAFQQAQLEPCSLIHRGSFLNSWPSMRTMKKHLELQSSNLLTFQSETSLLRERGQANCNKRHDFWLSGDMLSHMAIAELKKKIWRTPNESPEKLAVEMKRFVHLRPAKRGPP